MAIQVVYHNKEEYLFVKIRGEWTDRAAKETIEDIKSETERYNQTRVLINMIDVLPPKQELTRYKTGDYMAQIWGHSLKVASVWKQEYSTKFAENVAVNRGAWFEGFSDENSAVQWLLSD